MKKLLLPIATVMALFCACTESEVVNSTSSDLVSFGTYVGQTTRASSVDLNELKTKNFKVAACYTSAGTWEGAQESATPNFMYDDAVKWNTSTSAWEYANMKYWPKEGYVSFFAYSPEASTNVDFSSSSATGIPHFTYTVPDAVSEQEDLLANQQTDKKHANARVSFAFDHLLSKIGFKAALKDTYTGATVKVTGFKVDYTANSITNKATYTFADDNSTSDIWKLEANSFHAANSQNILMKNGVTLSTTGAQLNANDMFMMLLPQAVAAEKMVAAITYTVTYSDETIVNNVENIKLPACTWEPGKQYTYNFNITLTKVEFDAVEVTPWGDAPVIEFTDLPEGNKINLEAEIGSEVVYATTGIASITHNSEKFNVAYEGASISRAVSNIAGKLTFTPKAANETNDPIEEEVTVTMTDVLGNESSMVFHLTQHPPIKLMQNEASIESSVALLYNSQKTIYSIDGVSSSPSATFTIMGVAGNTDVNVSLENSTDFSYTLENSILTFSAKNTLVSGSDNKSASATVILTGTSGSTRSYTINLTQVAPAALMHSSSNAATMEQILQFKSTKDVHTTTGSTYTVKNATSIGGGSTLVSNDDFTVLASTSSVSISANNKLITPVVIDLSNKTTTGTVVLTNQCGEVATYTFDVTQYAVAFITRNNEVMSGTYAYRTNLGGQSKVFTIVNGTTGSAEDWVNEKGSPTASSINKTMNDPVFDANNQSFTVSDKGTTFVGIAIWRKGSILIKVANTIGEESNYTLNVERKGGTGGDKI